MRINVKVSKNSLLEKSRHEAEKECGFAFDNNFARDVLQYCIEKLNRIGKTKEYLPLLYKHELVLRQQMRKINEVSQCYCKGVV